MLLRLCLLGLFFTFIGYADTTKEGLNYLNTLRFGAGLIPLKENKALSKAATSHAKYLIQNQHNGHYEKKGKYAYTGKTPSERVIKAGYRSRIAMENISINTSSQKKSIDNLFSAIYHRFVFLNLEKDEVGLGVYKTKKKRRIRQAYVYNLGSSKLSKLCKKKHTLKSGEYYMKEVCKKRQKMIPQTLFKEKELAIALQNSQIVLYPYVGQTDVYPAFYNESPDPLPNYKVSGFPISVQFNSSIYSEVKLTSFKLYDEKGKEIKKIKILSHKNDPNKRFSKLEFALMPLARLEYAHTYTTVFEALADGVKVKKQWVFQTTIPKEKLYRIAKNKTTLEVKVGETILLYIVPSHRKDLLKNYRVKGKIKATFIDQNTLKLTLPKQKSSASITFGNKKRVYFMLK